MKDSPPFSTKDCPLVAVYWLDAHSSGTRELQEPELPTEPILCIKYGRLIRFDRKGAVVAGEDLVSEDVPSWRDVNFIPTVIILKIEVLSTSGLLPIPGKRGTKRASPTDHDSGTAATP